MRKTMKAATILLALLLALQLFGAAAPAVCADGAPDDAAAVTWLVRAEDAEGAEHSIGSTEEMQSLIGSGFSLDFGKNAEGGAVTDPTVADLRRSGLKITPPAGYSVSSVFICAGDSAPNAGSKSLLSLSKADLGGSGAFSLPAGIFASDYNASSVGAVFNGPADAGSWTVRIALDRISAAQPVLRYTAGALTSLPALAEERLGAGTSLAAGGDSVALDGSSRAAAALNDAVEKLALGELAKQFTGWRLVLDNGAAASVKPGDPVSLRNSATLEAQWKDVIVFRFTGGEKLYDGTPLVGSYTRVGDVASGDTLTVPSSAVRTELTNAGESEATLDLSAVRVMRGEQDVTGEYAFAVIPATLRVIQRGVTFTISDRSAPYTGQALVPNEFSLTSGTLAEGHSAVPSYGGQQTLPGTSTGTASFVIRDGGGNDVSANYNISVINGSLTVTDREEKQPLSVTMRAVEKEYDGTNAVEAPGFDLTSGTLLGGDKLVLLSADGSISGVGEGRVSGAFAVKNGEDDVTANYEISVAAGKLTVKPRAITLTADSADKDYDGQPLTKDSYALTSGSLVAGHKLDVTIKGSQTKAGSSANVIKSFRITDEADKDVTAQYSVTTRDGTLTVNGPSDTFKLVIKMKDAEKVYDGKPLSSKEFELSSGSLAEGDTLELKSSSGELTDVGEGSATAEFVVKRGENDVTDFYSITVTAGKLTVKQRDITLKADSASKIYDGRPLTSSKVSVSKGTLVKGHKVKATVTGSQTELGSSANVIDKKSVKITDGSGKDVTANYAVTTAAGTLTVNSDPITPITLSLGDLSKVYDGKPYRFLGADLRVTSGGPLPSGYTIEAVFNPEAPVDAGKYDVTIKSVTIRNASGADVTSRFSISRPKGSLTITQRPLTIETKAANKVYDGSALTERSTPNITGRMEDHQVSLRITGSQTKVGSSENTVSDVKITDKNSGVDVTKNYAITYQYGLLTVSAGDGASDDAYAWVKGSSGTLFIKLDHSYEGFEGLQVDGKDLSRSSYTSASGSTDIWLKADYLNTLSAGSHTITAKYASGESAKASFSVKSTNTTRTGDSNSLTLWLVILVLTLLGALAAAYFLVWGKKNRRWLKRPARK